ncbi:HEAT repeat domain-containing protein [Blastopirellula marina]|uniref:HEAT repeat domain-containing protein n=1 Tax=Blastopirellula marina TaxID=124 RepID=A0A2S8GBY0_9BACT|nr:HEAT repeat domain-containing protein [Blastopirellula marina]PQO41947.1 hypothetical protein C5Y98_02620 [Blastopirellula marina]PTL46304.1 HEAT repeat domain-containing protein [Blastopirellula marina]
MTRLWLLSVVLLAGPVSTSAAQVSDLEKTRAEFEALATEVPLLSISSVLYNRFDHLTFRNTENPEQYQQAMRKVTGGNYARETLLSLLSDDDPKIRTLAAIALFDREDPHDLPALVALCDDNAETFPRLQESAYALNLFQKSEKAPPTTKQTVGEVAKKMVAFYMGRSGFYYGVSHPKEPGFDAYWQARQHRTSCVGWFAVQLDRASQASFPVRDERLPLIKAVRQRIDALPADQRAWTLLYLGGSQQNEVLVNEVELLEACQSLGADKLLQMLQHKIPTDDPDLQPRKRDNSYYKRMQMFVLRHAQQLLRKKDSAALLACERWQRDYLRHGISNPLLTPWWAIAAAQLNPGQAAEILHAAYDRFQGEYDAGNQAQLCIALWQLGGQKELDFIRDWFYEVEPERGMSIHSRIRLIQAMQDDPHGREMIAKIIQDQRLDDLDWQSLRQLIQTVNAWTASPVVTEEDLQAARHPLGISHYHWEKERARKDYPAETKALEANLQDWRNKLHAIAPQLLKPSSAQQPDEA